MKKTLLFIAIFASTAISAQNVKFGVKAGANLTNITKSDGFKSLFGFNLGVYTNIEITDKLKLQPELLYSTQGGKKEGSDITEGVPFNYVFKFKTSYLNIPLMLQYTLTDNLIVEVGPQIGFLLNAELETNIDIQGRTVTEEKDVKDLFSTLDFGLNFGLAYHFLNGLNINTRYTLGLTEIIKENPAGEKNSVIQLGLGYTFN